MIRLHATRKLFEKLPVDKDGKLSATERTAWIYEKPTLDINPLSGWHGHLVTLQRRQCLLMAHDATRFPLVLPALTKPDFAELNDRFTDTFMNTLLKCGANELHLETADKYLRPLQVDTECNRSVQGTLNRMKDEFEHQLYFDRLNVAEMTGYNAGAWLADTPRTVKGKDYLWPNKEMLTLLSRLGSGG
ncbi:hypothetical protein J6I75_07325 [Pseudidiomarina sp. 1APP75-27a]|uniref:DUF6933 domain-containing protein n=1 Tax=Pseudidiomarina terrestris TaxID=2820060 RepID=UPI002B0620E7|nr:hypothetical protein [Pseudidiomarina sp. 1APP75-27a]MEA3588161.1 hypothetical protein [Pseudidiomarina sp. 1APP75-27a]